MEEEPVMISMRSFSESLHSPHLPVKEVALKEWAVCIEALGAGRQHVLVRKGGILEETREFRLEETSFYFYPTYEHQRKALIKPEYQEALERTIAGRELPPKKVEITHLAHVVDDICVKDEATLRLLDPFHILTHEYARERLHWKADKPLHVLTVRVYRLSEPKTVEVKDEYLGCKSWLKLAEPIEQVDLVPVLGDEEFHQKREEILTALGAQLKDGRA
jgi:hypothetical protein